jgi:hypothetical protein
LVGCPGGRRDIRIMPKKHELMKHELKILPEYYEAVLNGTKSFELRKDDRGYKVGDTVRLMEWQDGLYTGRDLVLKIKYILRDCPEYGLMEGYCILGF